jgi:hypothetical protein
MKRGFLWVVGVIFCGVLVFSGQSVADQLTNNGFEDLGISETVPYPHQRAPGWSEYGAKPIVLYVNGQGSWQTDPYELTQYVGEAASWEAKAGGYYQTVAVTPGSSGTVRGWVHILNMENPGAPNVAKIGIDPAGGTDPLAAGVIWASTDVDTGDGWVQVKSAPVVASAAVVTVFLDYTLSLADNGNAVFFDLVELTGTLADPATAGTPPDTSGLSVVSSLGGQVTLGYTLTDGEDGDDPAQIDPRFRIGRNLDGEVLPPEVSLLNPAQQSVPSAPDGDGTGTGTWRIQGFVDGLWRGTSDRTATGLVYYGLAPADVPVTVDIKISDWERTGNHIDYEGAGLVLMTPGRQYHYTVGSFDEAGESNTAVMTEAHWSIASASEASVVAWYNLEGTGIPTDGVNAMYYRLERTAGNTVRAGYSRSASAFTMFQELDVSGTPLDLSEDLVFAVVVNDAIVVNIDFIRTGYMPATPGAGGDGTTGLAATSAGDAHTFVWDSLADLAGFGGLVNAQFKITARDQDGWGVADETGYFLIQAGIKTVIPIWEVYR